MTRRLAVLIFLLTSTYAAQANTTSTSINYIIDSLRPEKDEATYLAGFRAIEEMGVHNAVQELILAARSSDEQAARGAIYALGEIGPEASASIPLLIADLDNWRGYWLARFGIYTIFPATRDSNTWIRLNAAIALSKFGAMAKDAVRPLIRCREEDPDGGVADAANGALTQIGFPAIPALKEKVHGDYMDTWAAQTLTHILPGFTIADSYKGDTLNLQQCKSLDQLLDTIQKDISTPVASDATHALFCLTRYISQHPDKATAQKVLPVLEWAWKKKPIFQLNKDQILWGLTSASGSLGPYGESTVPFLIDELEYSHVYVIVALESIGPKAVAPLTRVLENPDWKVRIRAIRALETIYTQESWHAVKSFWKQHSEFPYPYPPDEELQRWIGPPRE